MIKYTLKCNLDHSFESWFASSAAFQTLVDANMVACPVCGSSDVTKTLMAPQVTTARKKADARDGPETQPAPDLSTPANPQEVALAKIKNHVQNNSDYVGMNFAREARAIHDGDAPERAIYGEANLTEAKKLIEDGVPVAPLPFTPDRKVN
jgi:hypothetical protein